MKSKLRESTISLCLSTNIKAEEREKYIQVWAFNAMQSMQLSSPYKFFFVYERNFSIGFLHHITCNIKSTLAQVEEIEEWEITISGAVKAASPLTFVFIYADILCFDASRRYFNNFNQ